MGAWVNVVLMVCTALLSCFAYCRSAAPAALEKKIGEKAYQRCSRLRSVSLVLMIVHIVQYGIYFFFSIPSALPRTFPWPWWVSVVIALLLAVPSSVLLHKAARYAGMEPVITRKKQKMFRGVYNTIRHPIAVAELPMIWAFAFLLNSPFLVLFSAIWIPLFFIMCVAEEKDLEIRYGAPYVRYKKRTGMFFPQRGKRQGDHKA